MPEINMNSVRLIQKMVDAITQEQRKYFADRELGLLGVLQPQASVADGPSPQAASHSRPNTLSANFAAKWRDSQGVQTMAFNSFLEICEWARFNHLGFTDHSELFWAYTTPDCYTEVSSDLLRHPKRWLK